MTGPVTPSREVLFALATAMAQASPDALRLARNEADASRDPQPDAATFLKLDGERLGRDLDLYDFMATIQGGWQPVLPDIAAEVVLPLRARAPEAYAAGVEGLLAMGNAIYGQEQQEAWADIFSVPAAPTP